MRIAVCDDDQNFCKEMLKYLQDYFKEKKREEKEHAEGTMCAHPQIVATSLP